MQSKVWIPTGKAGLIYDCLRKKGKATKPYLQQISHFNASTLMRIMNELIKKGLVIEAGVDKSSGGRKPVLYKVAPNYAYGIGLEIEASCIRAVLCDLQLNVVFSVDWPKASMMQPELFLEEAVEKIRINMKKHHILPEKVIAMGICVWGVLDRLNGVLLKDDHFENEDWQMIKLCDYFEKQFSVPVYVDYGVNTALLAEYWKQLSPKNEHIMYVHAGEQIYTSFISQGKLVFDRSDLLQKSGSHFPKNQFWKKTASFLGAGLAGVIGFLQPEMIIMDGSLLSLDESFFHFVTELALGPDKNETSKKVEICKSKLGDQASVVGAAVLAINNSFERGD